MIDAGGDAVQPHWSPHGNRIAFWSPSRSGGNYRDIWTVPAEGGGPVPVTQDTHIDWNPVWSRDGHHLYFCSSRGGAMSLWRVPVQEKTGKVLRTPELVTSSPGVRMGQVTIAGDNRHIAYQADISTSNIFSVSFDPRSEEVVGAPVAITSGSTWAIYPDVSPDGGRVAFSVQIGGDQADIAVAGVDGASVRQLRRRRRRTDSPPAR
jgi:Tol biopolymer transport system component